MTGVLPSYVKLEYQALTCPLGVRFLDAATQRTIGGLRVVAYPPNHPEKRITAVPTRSEVYGFHGLPGLRDFEHRVDNETRWVLDSPLSPRPFVVEVDDPEGRFLPARFVAEAPARVEALQETGSPPGLATLRTETLYSSPSRLTPGGCAVLRAQVFVLDHNAGEDSPAAWMIAGVSTEVHGRVVSAKGAADSAGRLTILFPYPEPVNVNSGSPPSGSPQLLSEQTWTLAFEAWHAFGAAAGDRLDLDAVRFLTSGQAAAVWEEDSPLVPFDQATLIFGRELVVPARVAGDQRARRLFVSPGS